MRKALLVLAVISAVAVTGWVTYATTVGAGTHPCGAPVCDPAAPACPHVASCHGGQAGCTSACPAFKDTNADGVCDMADDCGTHAEKGRAGHGDRSCGGHGGRAHGCSGGH